MLHVADRVFDILKENNPELTGEKRRTIMKPPQVCVHQRRQYHLHILCHLLLGFATEAQDLTLPVCYSSISLTGTIWLAATTDKTAWLDRQFCMTRLKLQHQCMPRGLHVAGGARRYKEDCVHQLHGAVQGHEPAARACAALPAG